jgi:hypothetical protein
MTFPGIIAKTRIFDRLEQFLNTSSVQELAAMRDALGQGRPLGDLLQAVWQSDHPLTLSKSDQGHLMNHVFNRNGKGWWGADVEAIATEAAAQALTRMLFTSSGESKGRARSSGTPRAWPKRIDCWWALPSTHYFHNVITESEQQITWTFVTPAKGDQLPAYELYKEQYELASRILKRPLDPTFVVPDNFTRRENSWMISAERWALTHGVDKKGKPRRCAEEVPLLSGLPGVTVTRSLCEDYKDRYLQLGGPSGSARAKRK